MYCELLKLRLFVGKYFVISVLASNVLFNCVCIYIYNPVATPISTGPRKEIYTKGAGGAKGHEGSDEKLYCHVAIEKRETLFINDPTKVYKIIPGLEKNEEWDMVAIMNYG